MIVPRHWRALLRVAWEHALRRPLQSGLLVVGVALGVAVGVAIDLANASALSAFRLSTEAITGRATHSIVGGPIGLDDEVYRRVRVDLVLRASAPVIESSASVRELDGRRLTLLGVDPFAEPPFRSFLTVGEGLAGEALAEFLTRPGAVLVSEDLAEQAGLRTGGTLTLDLGGRAREVTIVGLLSPDDGLSRRALSELVVADVSTAQELLGREGRLDRVDLLLPEGGAGREALLSRVEQVLPPGVVIVPASEQADTVEEMTDAFRLNLTALSLLALLVGMFLVFNTVRFSVVQRRRTLATLRVLGVTRREVFGLVLAEALVLGALGSAIGLVLGVLLGRGAVSLVTQTVNDLFFVANVRGVEVPLSTLVRGALLGTGAAVVAALVPALEAMAVPPVVAMRRSDVEQRARQAVPVALAVGVGLGALAVGLLALPGGRVDVGFAALFMIVLGFALAAPAFTLALMALARPVTERLFGPIGRMAPRDVTRALSRTAVAIAALTVAVCVSIGVRVMVDSFRATVVDWLGQTLQADVFISPASVSAGRAEGALDPGLLMRLEALPGVVRASTARGVDVRSPDFGPVELVAVRSDLAGDDRRFLDAVGSAGAVWQSVERGAVMVSEPFARRHEVGVGDRLALLTDAGEQTFPIAGVFYDYGSPQGVVYLADPVYRRYWDDDRITSIALILAPSVDADAFARDLRARLAGSDTLDIRSNRGLRTEVLAVFDRTFAITTALRVLAIVVAFIGVFSALMALQLERSREYATLRATGLTQRQLGGLTLLETGLTGAAAGLLSWPAGLALAFVLIYIINRRSFGWTIAATVDPVPFASALALAIGAALLAGIYPALRLGRLPIARSLREE